LVKHNLLSADDECSLSRQYKLSVQIQAQSSLMSSERGRPISNSEVAEALGVPSEQISVLISKGEAAKNTLVGANMRLVFHIAKYYRYRGVAYPDLVQEGTFGLIKAVEKYDPEKGFRFSTYASWWIKQSISRAIAEKSRIVRLPVHIHDMMVSISRAQKEFSALHHRKPTPYELSEQLCLPLEKVELVVKCARDVKSIDEALFANRGKSTSNKEMLFKESVASSEVAPSSINEKSSVQEELRRKMRGLSEREIQIVELRFGLRDGSQRTLEEIGNMFNVTRERIRQIEARALSKMRTPVKSEGNKEIFAENSFISPSAIFQPDLSPITAPVVIEKVDAFADY
jgi:RNA polymerase primary sigma factor